MENQWNGPTSAGEQYYTQALSSGFEMEPRQWATAGPSYSMPSEQWPQLQYTSDETAETWAVEAGKATESIVVKTEQILPSYPIQAAPSLPAPLTPAAPSADSKRTDKDGKIKPYKARKGKKKGINAPSPVETSKLRRKIRKSSREKQRRLEINQKFEKLCKILHLGPAGRVKAEKLTILSETIDIISTLRAENAELRLQKANLRTQLSSFDRKRPSADEVAAETVADQSQPHVAADAASSAPCLLPCCVPAYTPRPRASSTESDDGKYPQSEVRGRAQSDASTASSAPSSDELAANDDASSGDESDAADADSHDGEESLAVETYPTEAAYAPQQSGLASPSARLSSISLTDERGATTPSAPAVAPVAGAATRTVAPTNQYSVPYTAPAPVSYRPQAPALSSPFGSVTELDQAMAFGGGLQEASLVLSTEAMAPPNDLAELDTIDADFFGSMDDEL